MRRTILIVLAVLVPIAAVGIGLAKRLTIADDGGVAPLASGQGLTIKFSNKPMPAPELALPDLGGALLKSGDWRGRVVLLNFWATWCGPCREEIPALIAIQERYGDRVRVVGLSIDTIGADEVARFAKDAGINYPVAIVPDRIQAAFGGIRAVPSTFVVNPEGQIVQRHLGAVDPAIIEHEVRALSKLPTPATVETVNDIGQILPANTAPATEVPGVDLSHLTPAQKEAALARLNKDACTCGCGLTVAQCRIQDPSCTTSPGIAERIVKDIRR